MSALIGQQIGNYKVISLLGVGGMGEVYLAEHSTIGTRVAVKVLQSSISKDQEQVNRFFNEAKAVNKIRHSGPVKIFDVGFHTDQRGEVHAYLVMEYLDGESLAARIKRLGTMPGEMVADIGRQIAGVLDAVHTAGITHRDLKPDNIFLIPDQELQSGERVKVLDFGIAKLTGTMAGPQTKGTMGTPAYMAPEQWNNSAAVDGKADTYSLGCVMFEMAVGKPPFPSQSIGEACNHHLNSKPPRASAIQRSVPPEFDELVDRMLAKTVDLRPTVREVTKAFDAMRQSGATSRWTAASMQAVSGVAATIAPSSSNLGSGSQPYLPPGSQPNIPPGSQPNIAPGSHPNLHLGHTPGMQNPLATPAHPSQQYATPQHPSQHYPAQQGSSPALYPPQPTPQHFTPQHGQFTPQHGQFTPQHPPGPQHTTPIPQHHTQPPQTGGSKKGLLIGLGALVVVGGAAAAIVVTQSGGGDDKKPGPGSDPGSQAVVDPKPGSDKPVVDPPVDPKPKVATVDAGADTNKASKRDQVLAKNPFVDRHGVRVLTSQVNGREYALVIGTSPVPVSDPEAPLGGLTQQEASAFCSAIGARLPTSDDWSKAAKGAWCIAVGATCGPLQEWTSTVQDELAVVRGGHDKMSDAQRDKAALSKPPYFLQKDPAGDRKTASSPTIGFRCVDGGPAADLGPPTDPTALAPALLPSPAETLNGKTWVSSVDKSGGGQKITQVTTLQTAVAGTAVTGTMVETLTVDGKPFVNGLAVKGTASAAGIDITSSINRPQQLPTGMTFCTLRGKLALDSSRPDKLKLSGKLAYGGPCKSGDELYTFVEGAAPVSPSTPAPASPQGNLSASAVRGAMKRQMPKLQFCYEKALAAKPGLAGTVQVSFYISADGAVTSASATGLDPTVASCIAGVIKSTVFPKPTGGGGVQVNYPLTFKPQAGDVWDQ